MATLFRLFVLKELHGWDHETALVEYLKRQSDICEQLGIGSRSVDAVAKLAHTLHRRSPRDCRNGCSNDPHHRSERGYHGPA